VQLSIFSERKGLKRIQRIKLLTLISGNFAL